MALNGVALDVMPPVVQPNDDDPDTGAEEDGGGGDDCESYQACAFRACNECQLYAKREAAVITAAAEIACTFVAVAETSVTKMPILVTPVCVLLTDAYLTYVKRLLEEECTVMKCGYYPYCI